MLKKRYTLFILFACLALSPATIMAITLNECIETALEMNPDLDAAAYRVKASRAAHLQARSPWYPALSASGSYMRTNNPSQAFMMELNQKKLDMTDPGFDPADPDDIDNTRIRLGMRYLLYDGGRSRLNEQMAEQGIDISRYEHAAVKNELIYEVTRGYYEALKAGEFIAVFRKTADSIEKSLQLAKQRFQEGTAVKTDVLNLEVQLLQAQEDLIVAENGFSLAIAALNTSIGADIVYPDKLLPPERKITAPAVAAAEQNTVAKRPEMQAAALIVKSKKLDLTHAKRAYLPSVEAMGALDLDSPVSDNFEDSYVAGVTAKWDIFSGYARSAKVSESRALRNESLAFLKKTRKQLELDLKQAELQLSNAFQRLDVTRKAIENAEESLRITRERYENGAVEITALLNAQSAMTASSVRNKAAYYDYLEALANIKRATGEKWPW
ncbi:MAG: TolC family protein [Desulfosalsimonadaceae bacterium]